MFAISYGKNCGNGKFKCDENRVGSKEFEMRFTHSTLQKLIHFTLRCRANHLRTEIEQSKPNQKYCAVIKVCLFIKQKY